MADQEDPERMEGLADSLEAWLEIPDAVRPATPFLPLPDLRIIINCLRLNAREIRRKAKLIEEGK